MLATLKFFIIIFVFSAIAVIYFVAPYIDSSHVIPLIFATAIIGPILFVAIGEIILFFIDRKHDE